MPSVKERFTGWVERVRERRPFVDHLVRMQEHYGSVKASQQAGAVTYFAFLSIFPILAIAFFVVGKIAQVYPGAQQDLIDAINAVIPGLIEDGETAGQISVENVEKAASTVGIFGALGLLYAGLGWLSAMRSALMVVFEQEQKEQPNFVVGKLRDLVVAGGDRRGAAAQRRAGRLRDRFLRGRPRLAAARRRAAAGWSR